MMKLTIREEREMGRCEKERADFKQQKADLHRFLTAKFGDSRALFFFFAHGHMFTSLTHVSNSAPLTELKPKQTQLL